MLLRYGALAAVASSVWSALLALTAVPVYLSRLGLEAYGVIGFFITLQAILQVLDLGLAPAMNREMARASALGELEAARKLLRTLGRVYWLVALAIVAAISMLADPIATNWLGQSQLPAGDLHQSLVLIGCVIAARWPIAVYQNALIGLGRLVRSSLIGATMATISVGASVSCVLFISSTLPALFLTQAIVTLCHAIVIRAFAWQAIGGRGASTFDLRCVQPIWRFSLGMSGVVLSGVALTQLDKAVLSRMMPLAAFGEYMLAATVVGGLSVVVAPLFSVIFPRFSSLVASKDEDALRSLYKDASRFFAIAYLPIVMALGVYAGDVLLLWIGDASTAAQVAPLVSLLCIGSAINGLMYFPYSLQLAYGRSRIPLAINVVLLILFAPMIFALTLRFGGIGAAAAWAVLEVFYLLIGTWATHRFVPVVDGWKWLGSSVLLPLAACAGAVALMHPLVTLAAPGSPFKMVLIAASVLAVQFGCAALFPSLRLRLFSKLRHMHPPAHPA